MRHLRILGLCVAAVFAVFAIAASSAFAGGKPEFGQCYAKAGGKYADSNCQTKAKGKAGTYEWRKEAQVPNKGFTGEGGTGVLNADYVICEPKAERKPTCNAGEETETLPIYVECTSEHARGLTTGSTTVGSVAVKFYGCKALGSIPCSNSTSPEEIEVNTLSGTLGYINKSKHEVGLDLNPVIKNGPFASFTCGAILSSVVGAGNKKEGTAYGGKGGGDGIISPIEPINQMTSKLTQVYATTESDENIPNKFEGKPLQVLESYLYNAEEQQLSSQWSKAGEIVTNVNTGEEEGEIKG